MQEITLRLPGAPTAAVRRAFLSGLLVIALVEFIRTSWLGDDAQITVRCILNALHGYGPTFNIDQRVQPFTHPLWFLIALPISAIVRNPQLALLILSVVCSLATIWLLQTRIAVASWTSLCAVACILLSKAFIDFSSGGLENPLANLLVVAVIASGNRVLEAAGGTKRLCVFLTFFGLLYLTRLDLVLLLGPYVIVVLYVARRPARAVLISIGVAALPVLAWTIFSVIYYGFIFPNTAYAKLGTGLPESVMAAQGAIYLLQSLGHDTLTLPAIVLGAIVGFRAGLRGIALSAGIVLYVGYIVYIGGDFMGGRFLVAPFVAAMALIISDTTQAAPARTGCLLILAALSLTSTILSPTEFSARFIPPDGIADERGYYFQETGTLLATRATFAPFRWPGGLVRPKFLRSIDCGGLGEDGLKYGPETDIIDHCALVDPFLARMLAVSDADWRIGHVDRRVPPEYFDSIIHNQNRLIDIHAARLYEAINLITRGPIFTRPRFKAMLRLNLDLPLP